MIIKDLAFSILSSFVSKSTLEGFALPLLIFGYLFR